jgi:hypothetical protein
MMKIQRHVFILELGVATNSYTVRLLYTVTLQTVLQTDVLYNYVNYYNDTHLSTVTL